MNEVKKELIRDVTAIFTRLPPKKQERAIGIMQGMMIIEQEREHTSDSGKRGASA